MPYVIVLCGANGSGKTTYAKEICKNMIMQHMEYDKYGTQEERNKAIDYQMTFRNDLILDGKHLNQKDVDCLVEKFKSAGYALFMRIFLASDVSCYRRIRNGSPEMEKNNHVSLDDVRLQLKKAELMEEYCKKHEIDYNIVR